MKNGNYDVSTINSANYLENLLNNRLKQHENIMIALDKRNNNQSNSRLEINESEIQDNI